MLLVIFLFLLNQHLPILINSNDDGDDDYYDDDNNDDNDNNDDGIMMVLMIIVTIIPVNLTGLVFHTDSPCRTKTIRPIFRKLPFVISKLDCLSITQ